VASRATPTIIATVFLINPLTVMPVYYVAYIVGRWLLTGPKVLLLDDPTRGVDVGAKAELYRVIRSLCAEGLGVIVTSSELPELLTLSDRIMVLSEGRKTAEFRIEDATQEKIMEAATKSWQFQEIDR
jgi:ABC-type sugar transport system ATPase subunit